MNKLFKRLILALLLVNAALWSIPSHALLINDGGTYDGTNVGVIDTWMTDTGATLDNSSPYTETDWVNAFLGGDGVSWTVSEQTVSYYSVDGLADDNVFAFKLLVNDKGPADYFLIKNSTYTALYQNREDPYWGVFDADDLSDGSNIGGNGDFTISHVTQLIGGDKGGEQPVPEPSISALLGIGLLGMIGVSRRRKV